MLSFNLSKGMKKQQQLKPSLPDDLVLDILLRLPTKSILRFRSVCQQWRASTSDPLFLHNHARRASAPVAFFTELAYSNFEASYDFCLINPDDEIIPRTGSLDNKSMSESFDKSLLWLSASCDVLLCFEEIPGSSYYVYNLITRQWTRVAKSEHSCGYLAGIYLHPLTGEYRLLRALHAPDGGSELVGFEVIKLGAQRWRRINNSLEAHLRRRTLEFDCQVALHGCLHWAPMWGFDDFCCRLRRRQLREGTDEEEQSIIKFDISSEEFQPMSFPARSRSGKFTHLIEIQGRLGLCQVTSATTMAVWVLKDSWIKHCEISAESIRQLPEWYSAINLFRPWAFWNQEELLVQWCYSDLFVYNLKSKTLVLVHNLDWVKLVMFKGTLAFYDAFKRNFR